jgi:hypothetical protein
MSNQIKQGRAVVLVIAGLTIGLSLWVIISYNTRLGHEKFPQQAVRLGLTTLMFLLVYRGSQVARWIAVCLLLLGGAMGILSGLTIPILLKQGPLTLYIGIIYIGFALALASLPSVNALMLAKPKRAQPASKTDENHSSR